MLRLMLNAPERIGLSINQLLSLFLLATASFSCFGCGGDSRSSQSQPLPPERPLRKMNSAMRRGQWEMAWQYADNVLSQHADDADAIASVARVAHELGHPKRAADLLVDACHAESFGNADRVRQATIALISVGRLHEGLVWLEEVISEQPLQHKTRRWLYDLYLNSEDRFAAAPHGRFLIRQRQFDSTLLLTLSDNDHLVKDLASLDEVMSRNPDDKRPLLRAAKMKFDLGEYDQSIEILRKIVSAHPDYLPAQALLGRSFALVGRLDDVERWGSSLENDEIKQYPGYWMALGDWALAKQRPEASARAYWEVIRRNPNRIDDWSKLSVALEQLDANSIELHSETIPSIERRTALLGKLIQTMSRFERAGSISRAFAVSIAETLVDLGRLWEAEAWASIAMALPEDDSVNVQEVRNSIVTQLKKNTPWQVSADHPELQLDLTSLELPDFSL